MLAASFMVCLSEEMNRAADLLERDPVADPHRGAVDPGGEAGAGVEFDDGQLVGGLGGE